MMLICRVVVVVLSRCVVLWVCRGVVVLLFLLKEMVVVVLLCFD